MGTRFLAIIRPTGVDAPGPPVLEGAGARLPPLARGPRLTLFADAGFGAGEGKSDAIVGALFDRGATRPAQALGPAEWAAIHRSHGRDLVERYWGAYVGFVETQDAIRIVRAPFGDIGCYHAWAGDRLVVSSHLDLLLAASGRGRRIEAGALSCHIAFPEWRSATTCLDGIGEVRGGDCLTVAAAGAETETLWSPWAFVADAKRIDDPDEAVRTVGNAVRLAVAARTNSLDRSVLLLSGGLDSSIMATCLAQAGADFACLNLIGDDAASDETRYARLAADAVCARLLTRRFELDRIDVARSDAAHMPYPVHRCFTQAQDRMATEVAQEVDAEAIIDGGGGDNVFLASRTVAILADCLIDGGFDRRFRETARVLGDLGQTGLLTLTRKAMYRAWWRSRAPRLSAGTAFLSGQAREAAAAAPPHPWFDPPGDMLPGRAAHVALLVPAQNLAEALNAQAPMRAISPLVSQPVAETCLRVPSWLWLAPGRDRAIARRAFEAVLPQPIVNRRSKGTPTGFVATIYDRNRSAIRDLLLGGTLAALGILDRRAVESALQPAGPVRDLRFVRIMELVDAEAWARSQA